MGDIVTFYSYKGGVGRSMALANIAYLLAQRGLRVLTVDWDLEAPGLERYFSYFEISAGGPGLMRLLCEASSGVRPNYRQFTSLVHCGTPAPITLLASGREQDPDYSRTLEHFDWADFFAAGGGAYIEDLREAWRNDFDIVLVDSRTGLSDSGGVCTIQLPDAVVAIFTANYQSLYGVRDVLRLAQQARQRLAYDRMPLSVLPLPSRWGMQEFQETQIWLDRIVEGVQEFYADWLPRPFQPRHILESVKIPHSSYFGFGERLAAVEQGTMDPQGMGFAYEKVARFLASGFSDVAALIGKEAFEREVVTAAGEAEVLAPNEPYDYDIFISLESSVLSWAHDLSRDLQRELSSRLAKTPRIYLDVREVDVSHGHERTAKALARSKVMLAILTPRYAASKWTRSEYEIFSSRGPFPLIVPVLLRGEIPDFVHHQVLDFRKYPLRESHTAPRLSQWASMMGELTDRLVNAINVTTSPTTGPREAPDLSYDMP